jgi:hypothetical protein
MAGALYKIFTITAAFLAVLLMVSVASPQEQSKPELDETAKQRVLDLEAANALWRLKGKLGKEGFYSGRVALNVWRSAAMDAGKFDLDQYNEFKKQLYEKSVNDSLRCFEESIMEEDYYDANVCLQTWRMHAKELGTYDQEQYEALKKKMTDARSDQATEKPAE